MIWCVFVCLAFLRCGVFVYSVCMLSGFGFSICLFSFVYLILVVWLWTVGLYSLVVALAF